MLIHWIVPRYFQHNQMISEAEGQPEMEGLGVELPQQEGVGGYCKLPVNDTNIKAA